MDIRAGAGNLATIRKYAAELVALAPDVIGRQNLEHPSSGSAIDCRCASSTSNTERIPASMSPVDVPGPLLNLFPFCWIIWFCLVIFDNGKEEQSLSFQQSAKLCDQGFQISKRSLLL
jgi:hypothetical protein